MWISNFYHCLSQNTNRICQAMKPSSNIYNYQPSSNFDCRKFSQYHFVFAFASKLRHLLPIITIPYHMARYHLINSTIYRMKFIYIYFDVQTVAYSVLFRIYSNRTFVSCTIPIKLSSSFYRFDVVHHHTTTHELEFLILISFYFHLFQVKNIFQSASISIKHP